MAESDLIRLIAASVGANREAMRHQGRIYGLLRGIVTDNAPTDPTLIAQRAIRCQIPAMGVTNTGWLQRLNIQPAADPPLPRIGDTVAVEFIQGNPHDGVWMGVLTNLRNPPFEQADTVRDNSSTVPGDNMTAVMGNQFESVKGNIDREVEGDYRSTIDGSESRRTEGSFEISGGKEIAVRNDAGCDFFHDTDGSLHHIDKFGAGLYAHKGLIVLMDKFGNRITLGGSGGVSGGKISASSQNRVESAFTTDFYLDMGGHALHIENASDVTINGISIIVLGSVDSGGDVNNDRGY
jgi:hypothetical protein